MLTKLGMEGGKDAQPLYSPGRASEGMASFRPSYKRRWIVGVLGEERCSALRPLGWASGMAPLYCIRIIEWREDPQPYSRGPASG